VAAENANGDSENASVIFPIPIPIATASTLRNELNCLEAMRMLGFSDCRILGLNGNFSGGWLAAHSPWWLFPLLSHLKISSHLPKDRPRCPGNAIFQKSRG